MLSENQVGHFHERGFVVLEQAIAEGQIAALRAAAAAVVDSFDIDAHRTVFSTSNDEKDRDDYFMDSAQAVHCFLEEDALDGDGRLTRPKALAINKIGHAMHDLDPGFREFCRLPLFAAALRDLGYRAPALWQSMYIFKQPRIGGEVRWHQDASFLATSPACVTGVWVALEDAHTGNGCLWTSPGAHRSPLREIYEVDPATRRGNLRQLDDTPWPTTDDAVALEVPAGSVVLFSDHLPHYSSRNTSDASRHAFTMHVAESGANWSPRNWLQRPSLGEFLL